MRPVFAKGNSQTVRLLLQLRKEAINDLAPRVAQRFHAMALSIEGRTASEIAQSLKVHRSCIPLWIENWNRHREQGLLEGHRAGRPVGLDATQREQLQDILDSGPVAYGLETRLWTSPVISRVIADEFDRHFPDTSASCSSNWAIPCSVQPPGWCRPIRTGRTGGCVIPIRAF